MVTMSNWKKMLVDLTQNAAQATFRLALSPPLAISRLLSFLFDDGEIVGQMSHLA